MTQLYINSSVCQPYFSIWIKGGKSGTSVLFFYLRVNGI